METKVIDQTASELQLNRALFVIQILRAMILHLLLAGIGILLYFLTGIDNAYPLATAAVQAARAAAMSGQFEGPFGSVGIAIVTILSVAAFLTILVWTYRSITGVRRWAFRLQSVLILLFGFQSVRNSLPDLEFAFKDLSLSFALLATMSVAMVFAIMPAFTAWALFRVSQLRERSSLLATLDPRLAPNLWVYLNKLLDLPRTPLRTPRIALAYVLALVGALLMIASMFYLMTVGGAGNKLTALGFIRKQISVQQARIAGAYEAWRIILLLSCALVGVKLAALLQSTAKKLGGLSVSEVLANPGDCFVLYLRPFDLDDVILSKPRLSLGSKLFTFRPYPVRIEEELFDVADGYRPLIAVGKPTVSGRLEGGAAYRAYLNDFEWQEYVAERIERADRIVLVLKNTEGVLWEFHRVLHRGAQERTLFLFHPEVRDPTIWQTVDSVVVAMLQTAGAVPQNFTFSSRPIGFFFQNRTLMEVVNDNWSATSYRTAFSHFLAESLNSVKNNGNMH